MLFESVFDSLGEVREQIESGRISGDELYVVIDKTSIGVFLSDSELYFDEYMDESYFQSYGGEHEKQVLFYGSFNRVEEFVVELVEEFLSADSYESLDYRGSDRKSDLL
jgi:hypothetical protein